MNREEIADKFDNLCEEFFSNISEDFDIVVETEDFCLVIDKKAAIEWIEAKLDAD